MAAAERGVAGVLWLRRTEHELISMAVANSSRSRVPLCVASHCWKTSSAAVAARSLIWLFSFCLVTSLHRSLSTTLLGGVGSDRSRLRLCSGSSLSLLDL